MAYSMDNDKIKIGDQVGWKEDFEKYGRVEEIKGSTLIISVFNSNTGDRDERSIQAKRTWVE